MVTKDQFVQKLEPLKCSICLDDCNSEHVPVQLSCGHIFGDHCIVEQTETRTPNNNRCPLCRQELFDQEDSDASAHTLNDSDESEVDNYNDDTDADPVIEDEQVQQLLSALLGNYDADVHTHRLAVDALRAEEAAVARRERLRERLNRQREFREHADRRRAANRASAPKSPRRARAFHDSDEESDSGSEYEPEDDSDPADEREEKRAYRLLPGEHDTTLRSQPSAS